MSVPRPSPARALALSFIATFVLSLSGCCCSETKYTCRVCVAKPSCRHCVTGIALSEESAAILDAKKRLCEGLLDVSVPGLDTNSAASCLAGTESMFAKKCRKESHVGGTTLGGRVW